jgi:exodeoxyribonuclease V beta subunit
MRIIDEVITPELITVAQKQFDLFAEKCLSTLDLLETCQEEVDDLMFNGKPLNGVSYKANMFEKKWAELDNCLRTPKQTIKILNYFGGDIEVKVAKGKPAPQHELFDRCAELAEMEIPDLLALKAQKIKTDFMQFMISESEKIKAELNIMTFDDLINTLHKVLQNEAGSGPLHQRIRDKYKIALVDEFQDTDPIQYQVFSSLFGNKQHCSEHAFYMIGDPKQSIYRFRGADIFAYLEAKQHADQQLTLDTNYRSEPKMVDAVNQFFMAKGSEEAFAYAPEENQQGICFEPVKSGADKAILNLGSETEALQLRWVIPNTEDPDKEESKTNIAKLMPKLVTREIVDILNKSQDQQAYFSKSDQSTEAVKPGDIAILVNSHRQAQEMKSRLNQARIPVVIQKSGNVFDSAQAKDLLRLLEAISDPRDRTITPLLLSSFFSFSAASLKAMSDETRFTFLKEFIDYQKFWESRGLLRTLQKFMDRHELYTSSLAKENGERIISNLFQIRELLHEEETLNGLGLTGLIRYLNEKITSSDKDDERYLQRLETDANAVQILTIHKSKGLEFPIVFCPYMWNQNYDVSTSHLAQGENNRQGDFEFHDKKNEPFLSIDSSNEQRDEYRMLWRREVLGEQLRLLYVALTRAANRCYLYWGNIKNEPSLFSYLAQTSLSGAQLLEDKPEKLDLDHRRHFWEKTLCDNESIAFQAIDSEQDVAPLRYKNDLEVELIQPKPMDLQFECWMDGSYSALTRNHGKVHFTPDDLRTHDEGETSDEVNQDEIPATGFYAFPRGAMPGVAIHEIFEHIDFQDETYWDKTIRSTLKRYNLHGARNANPEKFLDKRVADVIEMLKRVLSTKLAPCDFSIDQLSRTQRLDEMEFYYPVENIELHELKRVFAKYYTGTPNAAYIEDLDKLNYQMQNGFFNGSIDLAFQYDNKFYVLDWKSNHLGNSPEKYDKKSVKNAVREHFYFLQYHIYTLALHLYLEKYLADYDYETHFGGCIYTFVRGFESGTDYGIHYDRLPLGLVQDLKQLIVKGVQVHG